MGEIARLLGQALIGLALKQRLQGKSPILVMQDAGCHEAAELFGPEQETIGYGLQWPQNRGQEYMRWVPLRKLRDVNDIYVMSAYILIDI